MGEVWTRSVQNFKGYWGKPEETARTLGADGWLRTGDAGFLDEAGYLFLTDRVKDMIISGGENVYPAEVENVLSDHPAVADVAVIGVPDVFTELTSNSSGDHTPASPLNSGGLPTITSGLLVEVINPRRPPSQTTPALNRKDL